jgi:HK97 family phage prohead protease
MLAPSNTTTRAAIGDDGTVEGYASLFGAVDQANDMVLPGAFTQTLRLRDIRRVPMLFQHDPAEPIGIWLELEEDWLGLRVRGRLIPEVLRARELLALLRAGTADGLSIGFRTVKARVDPKMRVRKLVELDLWEISLVTFPLLPGARLRKVKAIRHDPDERFFRRHPRFRFKRPLPYPSPACGGG